MAEAPEQRGNTLARESKEGAVQKVFLLFCTQWKTRGTKAKKKLRIGPDMCVSRFQSESLFSPFFSFWFAHEEPVDGVEDQRQGDDRSDDSSLLDLDAPAAAGGDAVQRSTSRASEASLREFVRSAFFEAGRGRRNRKNKGRKEGRKEQTHTCMLIHLLNRVTERLRGGGPAASAVGAEAETADRVVRAEGAAVL